MPSGKVHAVATTLMAGSIAPALVLLGGQPIACAAAFTAGCLVGLIVNPDLDVRHPTYSHAILRRSGGSLLGWLWGLFWWPYVHMIIPRHRHPVSHLPVLGTLIRVVYLLAALFLAWGLLRVVLPLPAFPAPLPISSWGCFLQCRGRVSSLCAGCEVQTNNYIDYQNLIWDFNVFLMLFYLFSLYSP